MSKHYHSSCDHNVVKFCKECRCTYCASCGKEWQEACMLTHYTYQISNPPYQHPWWSGTSGVTTSGMPDGPAPSCSHG